MFLFAWKKLLRNRFFIAVFFTFTVFSLVTLFVVYNAFLNIEAFYNQSFQISRTYRIGGCSSESFTERLNGFLLHSSAEIRSVSCSFSDGEKSFTAAFCGEKPYAVLYGKDFTEEDLAVGANKILLPNPTFSEGDFDRIGTTILIGGSEFKAVGHSNQEQFVLPSAAVPESAWTEVTIVTEPFLTVPEKERYAAEAKEYFGAQTVSFTDSDHHVRLADEPVGFFIVAVLCCMGVVNVAYLYVHYLNETRREAAICRICGGTRQAVACAYFFSVFLLGAVSLTAALLFYRFAVAPLLALFKSFLTVPAVPSAAYPIVAAGYLLLTCAIFLAATLAGLSRSPLSEEKKC